MQKQTISAKIKTAKHQSLPAISAHKATPKNGLKQTLSPESDLSSPIIILVAGQAAVASPAAWPYF